MQGPIDRRDSGTGGVIAFGHRWSHCSRAYMLRWDPDTNGPCLATQAQMVLLHLGTDGPLHSGTDGLLHSGTDGPFTFFFSQAQMVLLHLGTDGPLHSGTDGPFTIFFLSFSSLRHRWSCCIWAQMVPLQFFFLSQAQTVLLVSGTDGPVCGQPIYNYINK